MERCPECAFFAGAVTFCKKASMEGSSLFTGTGTSLIVAGSRAGCAHWLMDFFIVLILALLVGVSGVITFGSSGLSTCRMPESIANQFTRADGYLALGCLTIFALQCLQNVQTKGSVLPATIDTNLLVVVQLGFWLLSLERLSSRSWSGECVRQTFSGSIT